MYSLQKGRDETAMMERTQQPVQPILNTVEEAAQQLNLSQPALYEYIAYQGCPAYRFGRSVRVRLSEVQEWLEARREGTA